MNKINSNTVCLSQARLDAHKKEAEQKYQAHLETLSTSELEKECNTLILEMKDESSNLESVASQVKLVTAEIRSRITSPVMVQKISYV